MLHRVFIAINLPESTREELASYQEKWPELSARWTKPENLHITLDFIGNVSDEELEEIKEETKEIYRNYKPFTLKLSKIVYGPSEKMPRMIWAIGDNGEHVTLARLREWEFQRINPEERPKINEEINIEIPVNSIEIMESKLKRGGAEYTALESVPLSRKSEARNPKSETISNDQNPKS